MQAPAAVCSSLKRTFLTGESFFTNTFTGTSAGGEVTLAASLCGDMSVHDLVPGEDLLIQSTSYLASASSVALDTQFQGLKALFSGEALLPEVQRQRSGRHVCLWGAWRSSTSTVR